MEDVDEHHTVLGPSGEPHTRLSPTASVSLPDELSRRLNIGEPERHDAGDESTDARAGDGSLVSKWRQKEKLKTTAVALVLCLNIGVDPPDVIKISPCARLECWVDPLSMQPAKALETIGKNLQAQYERWQPRAKYKMHLDPTVDDVKKLCVSCRRTAKNERVLFHYNGHGVPRPTVNGEIWVFNSRYTQYIPLSMYELQSWLGTPCIYVLDCSNAGLIINSFKAFMDTRASAGGASAGGAAAAAPLANGVGTSDPMRDMIVLAACGAGELLPQNPDLPADVFTACLTTPIKVALRWFCSRSLLRHDGITKELIDRIPGRQTDRKTPLGELNWIFTAITDTIAWNSLPRALFQKLFRQDLLVASLFRNFLLAERIMAAANCTPVSFPRLPPTHQHPMWQAWDMAAEMCLLQLPALLADPSAEFTPSSFFSEQLTAFELWLAHGCQDKRPPEQLPIVLQVLLSQVHRLRALVLLGRFLDMGSWAVDLALSVGIFPYVLKLLQTTSAELRTTLVFIWCKILALDRSCQGDLVKDNGQGYFIKYLDAAEPGIDAGARAQAVFVLATVCDGHPKGQALCAQQNLHGILLKWLRDTLSHGVSGGPPALLLRWLCLCLGKLCDDAPEVAAAALREGALELLSGLLTLPAPELRAAAVFALGCLIHTAPAHGEANEHALQVERAVAHSLTRVAYDASPLVRAELAVALARFMCGHTAYFSDAVALQQRKVAEMMKSYQRHGGPDSTASSGGTGAAAGADAAGADGSGIRRSASYGSVSSVGSAVNVGGQQWARGEEGGLKPGSVGDGGSRPVGDASMRGMTDASSSRAAPWGPSQGASIGDSILGFSDVEGSAPSDALYSFVLETVLMLATDPSAKVAKLGRKVLRITQCEITPMTATPAPRPSTHHAQGTASAGASPHTHHAPGSTAGSVGAGSAGSMSSSLGSLTQKFVKTSRSWRSGFAAAGSTGGAGVGGAGVAGAAQRPLGVPGVPGASTPIGSASPPSPSRAYSGPVPAGAPGTSSTSVSSEKWQPQPNYSRHPYILRSTAMGYEDAATGSLGRMPSSELEEGTQRRAYHAQLGLPGSAAAGSEFGAHQTRPMAPSIYTGPLPASPIFRLSCERFGRPMLEPQASAWREIDGVTRFPWTAPPDIARRAARARDIEAAAARCRAVRAPSIRQQVNIIETHAESLSAVVFHSFHLLLVSADNRGYIRVNNGVDGNALNTFHVTNGVGVADGRGTVTPTTVTFMRQLNETDSNLLLACTADGAVRVWRSYLHAGNQRLASAWQGVPIHQPPLPTKRMAAFELCAPAAALFAVGGSHPDCVYRWDLTCEMCTHQIAVRSSLGDSGCKVAVDRLSVAASDPDLLLTSCSDRFMRVFDVRAPPAPVATIAAGRSPLVGVVMEPCARQGTIVTGSVEGELRFLDLRMASDAEPAAPTSTSGSVLSATEVACVSAFGGLQREGSTASTASTAAVAPPGSSSSAVASSRQQLTVLAAHPHAPLLATGTSGQEMRIWNADTYEAVGAVRLQSSVAQQRLGPVTCMAWHPYNLYLGAGGRDSAASVYIVDSLSARLPTTQPGVGV